MQPLASAKKTRITVCKRGETDNPWLTRENVKALASVGKHVAISNRGKLCGRRQERASMKPLHVRGNKRASNRIVLGFVRIGGDNEIVALVGFSIQHARTLHYVSRSKVNRCVKYSSLGK